MVCLIDPVGDVYACPFAIHDSSWRATCAGPGGFAAVWRDSELFADLRRPQTGGACESCSAYDSCRGGCMAAKFFTGLPLDGPDPECVRGHGEAALAAPGRPDGAPRPSGDHSHRTAPRPRQPVPVTIGRRPPDAQRVHGPPAPARPRLRREPAGRFPPRRPLTCLPPAAPGCSTR